MRRLEALAVLSALLCAAPLAAQAKLASIGIGVTPGVDSTAYTFSFNFNRTDPTDADAGPSLWTRIIGKTSYTLTSTGEVNIGNGTESSPNNVLASLDLLSTRKLRAGRGSNPWVLLGRIGPSFAADKNFRTKLYYLPIGARFVTYNNPDYPRFLFVPGVRFDVGRRSLDSLAGTSFTRFVPSLEAKRSTLSGWSLAIDGRGYLINGDTRVVPNGWRGIASASVDYRPLDAAKTAKKRAELGPSAGAEPVYGQFGIGLEGKVGYEEPLYKRTGVIALSINWYAP